MDTGRRGGGQDGLSATDVVGGTCCRVGLQIEVEREMHHDVRAAQLLGDRRIAHVKDVPLGFGHVAAPLVHGHDLLDLVGLGQPPGQQRTGTGGGSGDRDDGPSGGLG